MSAVAAMLLLPSAVRAEGIDDTSRAQLLFDAAKKLAQAGEWAEACTMFAESKKAESGVGVTLHLADCYEHTGRPASAKAQFLEAEQVARARGDTRRADLAHTRAVALEPRVNHLVVVASGGPRPDGWTVQLDDVRLTAEQLNLPLSVDPGDHVVTIQAIGQPTRVFRMHLDDAHPGAEVHADEPPAAALAATPSDRAPEAPPPATPALTSPGGKGAAPSLRLPIALSLGAVAVAGAGAGAYFLIRRDELSRHGCSCDPSLENEASAAADIAFIAGGAALVSSVVVLLVAPEPPPTKTGWQWGPVFDRNGVGAILRTRF
jgi:serine/threonine-protein kinase